MFASSKRLTSQGITWEQLAFQFVVVLLGVYLAISFESCAAERSRQEEAMGMLARVLEELRLDQAHFGEVIAEGGAKAPAFDALVSLMAAGSNDRGAEIDSLLSVHFFSFPTAFPRRAGYTAMVSGGYLTAIPDQGLAVRLANLYEHSYERARANGDLMDQWTKDTYLVFQNHWDRGRRLFLKPGVDEVAPARNAWRDFGIVYCDWYIEVLLPPILEEVEVLMADLESYLDR
jgi:hypothetical protein